MNDFIMLMGKVIALLKTEFILYGYSVSFWHVFVWIMVVSIVIAFLVSISN